MTGKLLSDYSIEELESLVCSLEQPRFRAKQLYEWLNKGENFDGMRNMPKSFFGCFKSRRLLSARRTNRQSVDFADRRNRQISLQIKRRKYYRRRAYEI